MGLCLIVKSGGGVDTSSATASAEQILSGYTIYRNDNKITGNMTNVGTQTKSGLNAGGSVTISSGYHNGSGSVTTNTLASQTSADIPDSSWCLSGYTYWRDGSKGTGTMVNRGKKTWSLGVNGSQTIEGGWHDGNGAVSQSGVKSDGTWRMLTPKTSQQTLCSGSTYYTQNQWCAGNSNLTASNIKKDITIFGVKGTWQGWVDKTVWVIKDGELGSGFNITGIWQGASSNAGWSDAHKTGKTTWGTWKIDGWYWKDEGDLDGYSGGFTITGIDTLGIAMVVSSSNSGWYRSNAKIWMDFNHYYGYTSNTKNYVTFSVNGKYSAYDSTDLANPFRAYSVSVPGGACTSYDVGVSYWGWLCSSATDVKKYGTSVLTLAPGFDSRKAGHQTWQIKNLWVVKD